MGRAIRSWFRFGGGQDLHLLAGRTEPVTDNGRNSSHYSLTISDADEVEAFLIEKGLDYHRQQRFDDAWQIYISDPDGYVIELTAKKGGEREMDYAEARRQLDAWQKSKAA